MIITKEFTFECAHMLSNYEGKCKNIHGHTYKLKAFIKGMPNINSKDQDGGMVCDFSYVKHIIQNYIDTKFDHSIITTAKEQILKNLPKDTKYSYLTYPFDVKTTCEMISLQILNDLKNLHLQIEAIELWETPTSSCYVT